jgi:uncharacterized protein (TIGR02757 family)
MNIDFNHIFSILEGKTLLYNTPSFIQTDPIIVPHMFEMKEDIEIAGLLTATIAWGQRSTILKNAIKLMRVMDNKPYEYTINAGLDDLKPLEHFIHRTFNGSDCVFFIKSLRNIYQSFNGLEAIFTKGYHDKDCIEGALENFRDVFFSLQHQKRTEKHVSNVRANASCKRLNMFLRWMVRKDDKGVDFGIWKNIPPSALHIPLDVHSGHVARGLGLLQRKQNDWKAVKELTATLREFDPDDPVKYDFALFGMGVFEGKIPDTIIAA